MKNKNYVEVLLRGGLGNQMFQFFSGLNLAINYNAELRINVSLLEQNNHLNSTIEDLNIYQNNLNIDFRVIKYRSNLLPNFITNFYWTRIAHHLKKVNYFESSEIGWDPKLTQIKPPILLNSYSQSYKYLFECTQNAGYIAVQPKIIKTEVVSVKDLIEKNNTFVLHIRRGDYLSSNNINSIGALDVKYFSNALKRVKYDPLKDNLVVFTDSPNLILPDFISNNVKIFGPDSELSAAEVLYLMSICKNLIVSNSTLSLVAALLNNDLLNIIVPKDWFKSLPKPNYLYPSKWVVEKSKWI